jgi:hypothetical protein
MQLHISTYYLYLGKVTQNSSLPEIVFERERATTFNRRPYLHGQSDLLNGKLLGAEATKKCPPPSSELMSTPD